MWANRNAAEREKKTHLPVFGYQSPREGANLEKTVRGGDSKEVSIRLQRVDEGDVRESDVLAGGIAGGIAGKPRSDITATQR